MLHTPASLVKDLHALMTVVTRFAPSPTGFLHIGGARTALFNWLYARHTGGKFLLRIEDTDRVRSTQAAVDAIFDGLTWLGLDWDEPPVLPVRSARHATPRWPASLLAKGRAYRCYATPEELEAMRGRAEGQGASRFAMTDAGATAIRAKRQPAYPSSFACSAPTEGATAVMDGVQGEVRVENAQLDDMVLLRSDGTPTYMLSVVVDDHDTGVTQVIRGSRSPHQHVPPMATLRGLRLGAAGLRSHPPDPWPGRRQAFQAARRAGRRRLSRSRLCCPKRCATTCSGWAGAMATTRSISTEQAIEWFDLGGIGRSPSRFDMAKLDQSQRPLPARMPMTHGWSRLLAPFLNAQVGRPPSAADEALLIRAMPALKERAKTLVELAASATFYMRAAADQARRQGFATAR